jgi:hypothetical protein
MVPDFGPKRNRRQLTAAQLHENQSFRWKNTILRAARRLPIF